jgi:hypothetical protein
MAAIAVGAVVNVVSNSLVVVICLGRGMATRGATEHGKVRRVRMAGQARDVLVRTGGDREPGVVECQVAQVVGNPAAA